MPIVLHAGVRWLSTFPNEDEKLFYGQYVRFEIDDIIEGDTLKQHGPDLTIYNHFQSLINNGFVDWSQLNEKMILRLIDLIKTQQQRKANSKEEDYSQALFHYFCKHQERGKITIN